jgi:hypothetical protein
MALPTHPQIPHWMASMRYDLTQPITDFFGKPIIDEQTPEGYTLGTALVRAMLFVEPQAPGTPEKKFKQGELARKIAEAMKDGKVDLTTEEMASAREQVGKMYLPLMLNQIWHILDAHSGTA